MTANHGAAKYGSAGNPGGITSLKRTGPPTPPAPTLYQGDALGYSPPYCGGCFQLGPGLAGGVKMAPRIVTCLG